MLLLVVVLGGIWLLGKYVPGGFIPDEDKGYLFVAVELPEGASLQRTDEVLKQVEDIVGNTKGVRSAVGLAGMNILNSLNFPNAATDVRGSRSPGRNAKLPRCTPVPSRGSGRRNSPPSPVRELLPSGRRHCRATATSPASACSCRTAPAAASSSSPAT